MLRFMLRRLLLAGISFVAVTFLIWLFGVQVGHATGVTPAPAKSYGSWLTGFLQGDFGTFSKTDFRGVHIMAIGAELQKDLMPTLALLIPAFIVQSALTFGLGIFASVRSGWVSRFAVTATSVLTAAPVFFIGVLLIEYVAIIQEWLPAFYLYSYHSIAIPYGTPAFWAYVHAHFGEVVGIFARHLILPVLTLVLATYPQDSQILRIAMLEVLGQDYIRAARAHGVPRWRITWGHALRNALLPILTQLGTQLPRLLFVGAIVEYVFQLPGIGSFFCGGVVRFQADVKGMIFHPPPRDLPTIIAFVMIFVVLSILCTLITDITYAWIDPRIRQSGG